MIGNLVRSADWKAEKHVPAIIAPATIVPGEVFEVEVAIGKEIPHPNTVEHHIAWAALYFVANGSQLPVEVARAEFPAHGPDVFSEPVLETKVRLAKPGTLHAVAYCNIHGLWESELAVG